MKPSAFLLVLGVVPVLGAADLALRLPDGTTATCAKVIRKMPSAVQFVDATGTTRMARFVDQSAATVAAVKAMPNETDAVARVLQSKTRVANSPAERSESAALRDPYGFKAIADEVDRKMEKARKEMEAERKVAAEILADRIKGPEVEISLPELEYESRRWTAQMKVKKTSISVLICPVTEPIEGESSEETNIRFTREWDLHMRSVDVDRMASGSLEENIALLRKGIKWATIAKAQATLPFTKPLGKIGYSEWTFSWDPQTGARFGLWQMIKPWQADVALTLLARLPEADEALAKKTKSLAEQDELFR